MNHNNNNNNNDTEQTSSTDNVDNIALSLRSVASITSYVTSTVDPLPCCWPVYRVSSSYMTGWGHLNTWLAME